jgi:hypothetical protein
MRAAFLTEKQKRREQTDNLLLLLSHFQVASTFHSFYFYFLLLLSAFWEGPSDKLADSLLDNSTLLDNFFHLLYM